MTARKTDTSGATPSDASDGSTATADTVATPPPESTEPGGSATPAIAERLEAIEAKRAGTADDANIAERALTGHRRPETVDTDEYAIREAANRAALGGQG